MSWYLLAAIPVFAVIVLVHEFGHFITAKWAGIRVDEFGIGFPPRAIGIKRGETIYSINWLPLGGFVRMPGENGESTDEHGVVDPRSFAAKPASKRIVVLLAGVTMNLLLAIVLFSVAHAVGQVEYPATIGEITPNSPAAQAGMRTGDHIVSVNGQKVSYWSDFVTDVAHAADKAPPSAKTVPVVLVVQHAGSGQQEALTVNALVHPGANQGHVGVKGEMEYPATIAQVLPKSPAAQAGMRTGDHIVSVNGQPVSYWSDFVTDVADAAGTAPSNAKTIPVVLVVQHPGSSQQETLTVNALVHPGPNQGHVGATVDTSHPIYYVIRIPLWQAPIAGVQEVGATVGAIGTAFQQIFHGTMSPADAFQGPVGIVQDSGMAASAVPQFGWYPIIWLTGALSVSLAIVNVLPIPALDGGRVLLILIEIARRGKRISPEREGLINLAGMGVLLSLMLVFTFFDVSRIFAH